MISMKTDESANMKSYDVSTPYVIIQKADAAPANHCGFRGGFRGKGSGGRGESRKNESNPLRKAAYVYAAKANTYAYLSINASTKNGDPIISFLFL